MADGVEITAGSGTTVATDDVSGVQYQRIKVCWGADGNASDTSAAAPLPIKLSDGTNAITLAQNALATSAFAVPVMLHPDGLNANGSAVSASSAPVVLASDQKFFANTYETVAASQTAQVLGAGSGATGDYIAGVLVIPATTSPGAVTLIDNATSITIFTGGATSVSNLVPFYIPLGMVSQSGAWKLTTGASVSCIGMGKFT